MSMYNKYTAKLRMATNSLNVCVTALTQAARVNTEEDIDVRIEAADNLIKYAQECKQSLLYFKNRLRDKPE